MTWDEIRDCARLGVTFGSHSVTHPIMSQLDDGPRAGSRRLGFAARGDQREAVPIFCYRMVARATFYPGASQLARRGVDAG
jgi:hypothetical protein